MWEKLPLNVSFQALYNIFRPDSEPSGKLDDDSVHVLTRRPSNCRANLSSWR